MLPGAFRNSCLLELHDIFVPHNSEDFHLAESTLVLVLGPQRESPLLHGTSDIVHEYPWGFQPSLLQVRVVHAILPLELGVESTIGEE